METRVYPVEHLLTVNTSWSRNSKPVVIQQGGSGAGFFLISSDTDTERATTVPVPEKKDSDELPISTAVHLIDVIQTMTAPQLIWKDFPGDDASSAGPISMFGNNLVIRQTLPGHEEIVRLLNLISESVAEK